MEKIKLKDGTVFNIEDGATQNSVAIINNLENIGVFEEAFTEENLARFEILNEAGLTTAIIKDKFLQTIKCDKQEDGQYKFTFGLGNVDVTAKRLKALEEAQASLIETQEIQDVAIMEIAEMIVGEELPEEEVTEELPDETLEEEIPEVVPEVVPEETPEEVVVEE